MAPPYAVVSFKDDVDDDDDEDFQITSEVPSCWLTSDKRQCYWPTTKNLNSLILRRVEPKINNRNWKLHDVTFENYYEKLEDARKRAVTISSADECSVPDEERRSRRQKNVVMVKTAKKDNVVVSESAKKKKEIPVPPDYSFMDDEQLLQISNIPILGEDTLKGLSYTDALISQVDGTVSPTESNCSLVELSTSKSQKLYPKIISSVVLKKPLANIELVSCGQPSSSTSAAISPASQSPSVGRLSPTRIDSHSTPLIRTGSVNLPDRENFSTPSSSRISIRDLKNVEPSTTTIRGLIETKFDPLIRAMAEMSVELKRMNENIERLQNQPSEVTNNKGKSPIVALIHDSIPFMTEEQLTTFEADIEADLIPKSTLVHYLKNIGGNSAKDFTIRILRRVFSNKLATKSSWMGHRNNFKVGGLEVMKCILAAVRTQYSPTDKEFEELVSEWFRQAKQRYERENTKAQKAAKAGK